MPQKINGRYGVTGNPQYEAPPFTDFPSVTPDTPLDKLNLNRREKDLPERQRTKHVHKLHPYLGKFVPQLVEIFLRKYRPRRVCDPFCGSGTTLVEANCLGIESVGCDICEFNCLLTKVKVARYDFHLLRREITKALREIHEACDSPLFGARQQDISAQVSPYLRTWYAPEALQQLLLFRDIISPAHYAPVFQVILSRAARSARLTSHYELDFPKAPVTELLLPKHRRICQPTKQALSFLVRYTWDTYDRLMEYQRLRTDAPTTVICGDARNVRFPPADSVITSPPYVGLIDYHEQHRYAYELLGLPVREHLEIGSASQGQSQAEIQKYLDDMTSAFQNVLRSLKPGGRLVVIIHDSRNLYDETAKRLGLKLEYRLRRHVNRRTGRRASDFFEDVIIWQV
ncbi:MAG: DNA methyltransferase [Gemmatales bacterium]|nr:DNA methyltransferase [Gemmatales bacterium]